MTKIQSIVSGSIVLASLLAGKSALAADCQAPMVFVSGVQEYEAPKTSGDAFIIRGTSAIVRVRLVCAENKTNVTNDGGLPQTKVVPKDDWQKSGAVWQKLTSAYVEFEGTISVPKTPDYKAIKFTDGSGASYTVTFKFRNSFAEVGDSHTKKEADDTFRRKDDSFSKDETDATYERKGTGYTKPEADDRFEGKGKGNKGDGKMSLTIAPVVLVRPQLDPSGGLQLNWSYRWAKAAESGGMINIYTGGVFLGAKVNVRGVEGIPTTSPTAPQYLWWIGVAPAYDIALGKQAYLSIGGGLAYEYDYTAEATIGNDPATQRQYFNAAMRDSTLILHGLVGLRFQLTESPSPAPVFTVGMMPGIELIATRHQSGGTVRENRFQMPLMFGLGAQW